LISPKDERLKHKQQKQKNLKKKKERDEPELVKEV